MGCGKGLWLLDACKQVSEPAVVDGGEGHPAGLPLCLGLSARPAIIVDSKRQQGKEPDSFGEKPACSRRDGDGDLAGGTVEGSRETMRMLAMDPFRRELFFIFRV